MTDDRVSPLNLPDAQFFKFYFKFFAPSLFCSAAVGAANQQTCNRHKHTFRVINPSLAFISMLIGSCTSFLQRHSSHLLREGFFLIRGNLLFFFHLKRVADR